MLQRRSVLSRVTWKICLALSLGPTLMAAEVRPNPWPANASPGLTALAKAAEHNRFAYVFFWKTEGDATLRKRHAFETAIERLGDRVDSVSVCVAAPEEKPTVDAFKVSRAPMPLVLAVAPNGAVTKAWPLEFRADTAEEGIVSDGMAACMKTFQDGKIAIVSVQNSTTSHAKEAAQAVVGFLNDERFTGSAEAIFLDPTDVSEAGFLVDLKVSPTTDKAVTVLLAPPGNPVATFVGDVTTGDIVAKVTDAKSGCCPDGKCGPGQCCPGGKCGPSPKAAAQGPSR